ncbi:hypothetical protein AAVH_11300 [Aphelenchoides avenae]|nr:hypothetical protein AAVH_11300 [Aphelenchus avenae]
MSANVTVCEVAVQFAQDGVLKAAMVLDILLCITTLVLTIVVVRMPEFRKMPVHPNLKVLLGYMFASYLLVSVNLISSQGRYLIRFLTYSDPCSLVEPAWLIVIVRGITYSYTTSFPLWHLALTVERILATHLAAQYERSGKTFGVLASVVVFTLSFGHTAYLVFLAFEDPGFHNGAAFSGLATSTNIDQMRFRSYALIAIDVGTLLIDAGTALANKYRMRRVAAEYSLARSYQINENVVVTMGLILPLDLCNAALFLVSRGCEAVILRHTVFSVRLASLLELAFTVIVFQLPVSLVIVMWFCKKMRRTAVIVNQKDESELFFEQFRKQIGATQTKS